MGKMSIFKNAPFLNALTTETIQSDPLDTNVYPFNTSVYVKNN